MWICQDTPEKTPTLPVQSVDAYVRTYAWSVTWQPKEKSLTIFYEYGALSHTLFAREGALLLTTTRPLSVALALCINSSSSFSSMLNLSCVGTSILSSSSSKNCTDSIKALSRAALVNSFLALNPVFVFAVVLLESKYYRLFFKTYLCGCHFRFIYNFLNIAIISNI